MRRLAALFAMGCAVGCGTILSIDGDPSSQLAGDSGDSGTATDGPSTEDAGAGDAPAADTATADGGPPLLVFATKEKFVGAGMGGYIPDQVCTNAATAVGLLGTYVAWVSMGMLPANKKDFGAGPWFTLTGLRVANTPNDLSGAGPLLAAINVDEMGTTLAYGEHAWTGSTVSGDVGFTGTCSDWSQNGTIDEASIGLIGAFAESWKADNFMTAPCTTAQHLYCFQKR